MSVARGFLASLSAFREKKSRPTGPPADHPVFAKFHGFEGLVPPGFAYDFAGTMIDGAFGMISSSEALQVVAPVPAKDEEYFEWIDLLLSVDSARDRYVVVELGAGYGRWAARALFMARQRGLPGRAVLVEAEPVHAAWARQHMTNNAISDFTVIEAAMGGARGRTTFAVRMPSGSDANNPRDWYGQSIIPGVGALTGEVYEGKPIIAIGDWGAIEVDVLPLEDVLASEDHVDLLDMDVQNAEGDVIEAGLDVLDAKVSLLHVGTHSTEVEARIRKALFGRGWKPRWDFPCNTKGHPTAFGPVDFQDGVQSWQNPRFRGHRLMTPVRALLLKYEAWHRSLVTPGTRR